jgi:ABC-type branched-subunit amino acid transport system substrate-binding protein
VVAAVAAVALGTVGVAALRRGESDTDDDGEGETPTAQSDTTVETAPESSGSPAPPAGLTIAVGQPVRVALLIPLGGASSEIGVAVQNGVSLAAEDFGEVDGFEVEIVPFDDSCNEEAGGAEAAGLVVASGDFVGVVGPSCSAAARGALPVLEEAGLAVVSATATSPDLPPLGPTVFSRTVLDDQQLEAAGLDVSHIESRASVQELYARYEDRFGPLPSEVVRPFVAYGYDALLIVLQRTADVAVVEAEGSLSVDTEALPAAIRGTSDFPGVTGPITFDSSGNRTS